MSGASPRGGPESAAQLQEAVEQREGELREAKKRLTALKEEEKNAKKKQFEKRALEAKEEIANARGDRSVVREQIAEAYRAQAEQERESAAISDQIWRTQLERVTEEVLFKKMRLEKAASRRSELHEEQREKEVQLSTLNAELSRRDVNSEAMLQDALLRADVLRQALKELEEDGSDLHKQWLKAYRAKEDPNDSNGKDFSLLDELMAQRQQRQRKSARDKADSLRQLNDDRFELSQKRRAAVQKRKELEMLAAKELVYPGFLAEVELGEGPPMDLVKMNLAYSAAAQGDDDADEDEEDEEGDEDLSELIAKLQDERVKDAEKVRLLKREVASVEAASLLRVELSNVSEAAELRERAKADSVNEAAIESAADSADEKAALIDLIVAMLPPPRLPDKLSPAMLRDLGLPSTHPEASVPGNRLTWSPMRLLVESPTEARECADAVVEQLIETAWKQLYIYVPPKAVVEKEQQWHETQGKSLQKEMKRRQLANIAWVVLTELVEEVVVESATALHKEVGNLGGVSMQFGDDILLSSIRSVCQSSEGNSRMVVSAHDELVRQRSEKLKESKHSMTVTWWAPPQGPAMPRPRKPVLKPWDEHARKLGHANDAGAVTSGWDDLLRGFTATRSGVIGDEISGKASISCIQLNPSGSLVCIGRANGEILVFSCPSQQVDPVLLRKYTPASSADENLIVEIGWSIDSTQLYTINHRGVLVLWSMQVNPGSKASKVKKLWRVSQLDEAALQAPRTELDFARNDTVPSTGCFHPGLTAMGSQPGIILGTTGGDVMKCTAAQSAGTKLINSEDLSPHCGVNLNNTPASTGSDREQQQRPHYTVKETFSAHKSKVIAVEFGAGDTLITLDSSGKVLRWPYVRDQFTGFGWFQPDRSCNLGLDHSFTPIGEKQNIFPPSDMQGSSVNPALDPRYLAMVKAAAEAVAGLKDLAVAPCAHSTSATGTLELTYPPKEVTGSIADCTVLEYGVSGAGAGLLVRHAMQRCEVSAASRGAIAPKSRNHMSFSSDRTKLYFLVSEETALAGSTLIVVGLHADRMSWLPIRVNTGTAPPNSLPALSVHSISGLPGSEYACVLNGGAIGMYSLQSGQKMQTISDAGWDTMSVTQAGSTLAMSRSGGSPEVWFMELKSEALQASEHVISKLISKLPV